MNEAKKLKYQQPNFMAVRKDDPDSNAPHWQAKKRWKIDMGVLLTWTLLIVLAIVFWYLIIKVF